MCKLFSETHYRNFLQTHKILIAAKYVRFTDAGSGWGARGAHTSRFWQTVIPRYLNQRGQIIPLPPILLLAPPPQIFRPSDIAPLKGPETRLKMAPRASSPNFARLLLSRNTRASTIHVARLEKKIARS